MYVTQRINYGWHNFSEKYRIRCDTCGKSMTRTVSDGCNNLADQEHRTELIRKLRVQAAEREKSETDTCVACLKAKLKVPFTELEPMPATVCDEIAIAAQAYETGLATLRRRFQGRVARWEEAEWVIDYISYDDRDGITLQLKRVNKSKPWLETEARAYVSAEKLAITTENFADRGRAVEAA